MSLEQKNLSLKTYIFGYWKVEQVQSFKYLSTVLDIKLSFQEKY